VQVDENQEMSAEGRSHREKSEDGWSQIHVFYGDRRHLHLEQAEWKSQSGQDKIVYKMTKQLEGGYFVDLAANDASSISNSYSLETNHNWNGLCIEANPKYWSRLSYRKCTIVGAVVGHDHMGEIDFNFGPKGSQEVSNFEPQLEDSMYGGIVDEMFDNTPKKMSGTKNIIMKRSTATLIGIFERFKVPEVIDYISLDVEGAETYIMEFFPFEKYKFKIMSIERPKEKLKAILISHGYRHFKTISSWGETIWLNESYEEELDVN
jgi:hypothetical protein